MREKFRAWAEILETFFLEVVFEERHDYKAKLTRAILFGGSKCFQVAVKLRLWLYNVRILRDKTLGVQVIAIGNLTVGGTGKTPVVEKFARELRDAGRNVAILSRGYRSKPAPLHQKLLNKLLLRGDHTPPRVVSDGKSLLLDSETAGDDVAHGLGLSEESLHGSESECDDDLGLDEFDLLHEPRQAGGHLRGLRLPVA